MEDNFFWNIEQAGANRQFRIKQTRGVFVDCEDFLPVTGTYPAHPLSAQQPAHSNLQSLRDKRHSDLKRDVAEKSAAFVARTQKTVPNASRVPDEGYVAHPARTSIKQRAHDDKCAARTKAGLTEVSEQPKEAAGELGLAWRDAPPFKTTGELKAHRAAQDLKDLKALERNVGRLKDAEQRLNAREMCYLRMQQKAAPSKTKTDVAARRRQEMIAENTAKFGEQTIGIHGQELPQYSAAPESKAWWTHFPRGDPQVQSQLLLKQSHKYWAPNDEMLLADGTHTSGPEDPFKQNRVQKPRPCEVPDKVTRINHADNAQMLEAAEFRPGYQT